MLLPLVPLRDVVIFPGVVTPLFVGRDKSINALQKAMADDKSVMLIAQRNADDEDPKKDDLYKIGTVSTILQLIKLPDGTFKVLVEGIKRASLEKIKDKKEYLESEVEILNSNVMDEDLQQSYINTLKSQFKDLSKSSSKIRPEIISQARSIERLDKLIDTLVGHLSLSLEDRQILLEEIDLEERSKNLVSLLENQLDLTQMEKKIRDRVKKPNGKKSKRVLPERANEGSKKRDGRR